MDEARKTLDSLSVQVPSEFRKGQYNAKIGKELGQAKGTDEVIYKGLYPGLARIKL